MISYKKLLEQLSVKAFDAIYDDYDLQTKDKLCEQATENIQEYFDITLTTNAKNETYTNLKFNNKHLIDTLTKFQNNNLQYDLMEKTHNKNIIIDYSSPNIAKDMHVGHLRSTNIGDFLANLLEYAGNKVNRINHIGDFGLPFGKIVEYIIRNNINIETTSLQEIYILSQASFDQDKDFENMAYQRTKMLQFETDEITNKVWKEIYTKSLNSYNKIYDELLISKKLVVKGESYYKQYIDEVKKELYSKNLIKVCDDGREIIELENMNSLTYVKSKDKGESYTYDTTDICGLWYRTQVDKADMIYYVVDEGQSNHFSQIFKLAENATWLENTKVSHINFGLILNEDNKKIKSRAAHAVKLSDIIEISINETENIYMTKHNTCDDKDRKNIHDIAIGSLKWYDLSKTRTKNYKFIPKDMLRYTGNTYTYVTYAMTRCKFIMKKVPDTFNIKQYKINIDELDNNDFMVLRKIHRINDVLNKVIDTSMPHYLCDYLYDLVSQFHNNYEKNRCLEYDDNNNVISFNGSRLILYNFVKYILETCFGFMNLPIIENV